MNISDFISAAMQEDIGDGDHSSLACVPVNTIGKAKLVAKEHGIIAGVKLAIDILKYENGSFEIETLKKDGDIVLVGDIIMVITGEEQSILKTERLLLNCMQRMSGIATQTNKIVELLRGTKAKVLDTRKTSPLLRFMEKEAVLIGGGVNHRYGLYDMIMLKDNHIDYAGGIKEAITKTNKYLKKTGKDLKIEVETRDLNELMQVLEVGQVDRIMLDNYSIEDTKTAVELINGKYETESSGGITINTIRGYAECGVDFISVGALTHSVKSLDISLKAI